MSIVAAILYFMSSSVLLAIVLGFAGGGLDPGSAALALGGGALVATFSLWKKRRDPERRCPQGWEWMPIGLFSLFAARAFLWVVYLDGNDIKILQWNNLGDLSIHLTHINNFAQGAKFWPDNPIFAVGKLAYPVGVDLFTSLLVLLGVDILRGLVWVGLTMATVTGIALWRWGRAFGIIGFLCNGGLAALLVLLPGRFTAPIVGEIFGTEHKTAMSQTLGVAEPAHLIDDPIIPVFSDFQGNLAWKSIPLTMFTTQRGLLFAIPTGLLLLCSWRSRFFKTGGWHLPFLGELLLYASMPIFHMHTFLVLSFLLATWFICCVRERRELVRLVACAFIPATVLIYFTIGMFQAVPTTHWDDAGQYHETPIHQDTEILGWNPGWMVYEDITTNAWQFLSMYSEEGQRLAPWGRFAVFWGINYGVLIPLIFLLIVIMLRSVFARHISWKWVFIGMAGFLLITPMLGQWAWYQSSTLVSKKLPLNAVPLLVATGLLLWLLWRLRDKSPALRMAPAFVLPAVYLFFLACNVKFAPLDWDNTKIHIWSYLIVLPFLWEYVIVPRKLWQRAVLCELLFFTGFLSLIGGLNGHANNYGLIQRSELNGVGDAVKNIPIHETFASQPTYNHPLLLNGRKVAVGFTAHLWSYGIKSRQQEEILESLLNGVPEWRDHAERLGTRYLFWGRREREAHPHSQQKWREGARCIARGDWGEIFDLKRSPVGAPAISQASTTPSQQP